MNKVTPFLKWAGGKRWLVHNHADIFPKSYKTYIEPFVGSGAVYFFIQPREAILADANGWLIDTYSAIKEDWERVYRHLLIHHKNHSVEYYYKLRRSKTRNKFTNAAKFIYLNRTCWNGLFRVNQKGEFNVPIGTKNNVLLDTDDFERIAILLSNTKLLNNDFEKIIDYAEEGDFVFADPPYTVKHDNNGFIKYNEVLFQWEDQVRLSKALIRAKQRGVKIILTNAHHNSIYDLYKNNFTIQTVSRKSILSGNAKARGSCQEYLIFSNI